MCNLTGNVQNYRQSFHRGSIPKNRHFPRWQIVGFKAKCTHIRSDFYRNIRKVTLSHILYNQSQSTAFLTATQHQSSDGQVCPGECIRKRNGLIKACKALQGGSRQQKAQNHQKTVKYSFPQRYRPLCKYRHYRKWKIADSRGIGRKKKRLQTESVAVLRHLPKGA